MNIELDAATVKLLENQADIEGLSPAVVAGAAIREYIHHAYPRELTADRDAGPLAEE